MIVNFNAHCRPSLTMRAMRKHGPDVSEGDKPKLIATRTMLGRKCRFYSSGEHTVDSDDVTPEEQHDSVLLRFAHASIIAQEPVGDKKVLWVDALAEPPEIWMAGMKVNEFLLKSRALLRAGKISPELVVDSNPIPSIKEILDV
jgi:hypothetical protein